MVNPMNLQSLNTPTHVIDVDNTSKSADFGNGVPVKTTAIIYNGSDTATFVTSGASAQTAVFPTSGTPKNGKVFPPGAVLSFELEQGDQHISAIQATSGTGSLYISFGAGE